jgi:glutamate synthase (NADPH/NADH) small chain
MSDTGSHSLNSKYAWREFARQELPKRSVSERGADFLEIYGLFDEATAREQASRCLQCPNPSCVAGCPLCNPIPQWLQLTAEGRFLEAAAVLGSATTMAEVCSRLCPADHMCEGACLLESISEPVAIRALEQFLVDYAFKHGQVSAATAPPNGRNVAVVGASAGGLAAADELSRKGYSVTVYDSTLVPGGLMVNGLPAFRLDQSIIQRRLDLLRRQGVKFELGTRLWEDITLDQLRAQFDAVYLAFDSRRARDLDLPGADLQGVVPAVSFLLQKSTPVPLDLPTIEVAGKRVVVIGGGETAINCLRAALRYGAAGAVGVYRREAAEMPCGKEAYERACEEGVQFLFRLEPVAVLGNAEKAVTGLRCVETKPGPVGPDRRRSFLAEPGTENTVAADLVIPALGFNPVGCPQGCGFDGLHVNASGGIVVDQNQMTSLPGVFAGGDVVRGPCLLLHAVRDARQAAARIHAHLSTAAKAV